MRNFTVALVQHRARAFDVEANTETALRFIDEAADAGADFVVFPECFLTSYDMPEICASLAPLDEIERHSDFVRWRDGAIDRESPQIARVREKARERGIGVEVTAFTKGKRTVRNTAFIIGRDGNILLEYAKVHTCDFSLERYVEGGGAFHVCDFDGIRIGTMICYDREHPESGRELMLQGAELVFVPNDCPSMFPRLAELSACAMQNMVGVAMANPPGDDAGTSCAFSPVVYDEEGRGIDNAITVADEHIDGLVMATFDMEELRAWRTEEFLGKNRKPSAYKHLLDAYPNG